MLSYRCTNRCRHCLYRCSPEQPDDWMTLEMAEGVFRALKNEPVRSIHLAGGEPTMREDLLVDIIRLGISMDIPIEYVETNGAWCSDDEKAIEGMTRFREAGLPAILVSVSMFHNEFIPYRRTKTCLRAARKIFGPNVIVWLREMETLLDRLPNDGKHTLEEFAELTGLSETPEIIPRLYHVVPGGRAVNGLRQCYDSRPAAAFRGQICAGELMSTQHFHIDPYGNLFTGLCAGIAPANVWALHPKVTPKDTPVFHILCEEGPCGLLDLAEKCVGFSQREDGYVSKCDLCLDARGALQETGKYEELRPENFYRIS